MPIPQSPSPAGDDADAFDDFDDFQDLREHHQPRFPGIDTEPPSTPDGPAPRKRLGKYPLFIGAGAVALLVAIALIMLLQSEPVELATTPRMPPTGAPAASTPPAVQIDLLTPDDRGTQVVLSWKSNPENLDFGVVVTGPNGSTQTLVAHRNHTYTVPVDPVAPYCFQIEATNSDVNDPHVYLSQAVPIRAGTC